MPESLKDNWTKVGTVLALVCAMLGWGYTLGVHAHRQETHTRQINALRTDVERLRDRDHVLTELQANMRWLVQQVQHESERQR